MRIPDEFASNTVAREGERGNTWIAALPGLVDELLQRWNCAPAEPMRYGNVGVILPVRHPDLPPAVLKVSYPHPGNVHEPDAFATWAGRGAVTLYERDDPHFAMLLERASFDPLWGIEDDEKAVTIAGGLSRRLAVAAPAHLPRLGDLVGEWERKLRADAAEQRDPLPPRVTAAALANLRELGPDQPDVLVHGDLHWANILRADREPWLAIDPKGYVGDPAYDTITALGFLTPLTEADPQAALQRRIAVFADAAELDRDRARRWTQARAVIAAFWGRQHGDPDWLIRAYDQVAELLL
jgi:streptomycin 6-kinase